MAFKVELSNNSIIKNSFESISKIVDEITNKVEPQELKTERKDLN